MNTVSWEGSDLRRLWYLNNIEQIGSRASRAGYGDVPRRIGVQNTRSSSPKKRGEKVYRTLQNLRSEGLPITL